MTTYTEVVGISLMVSKGHQCLRGRSCCFCFPNTHRHGSYCETEKDVSPPLRCFLLQAGSWGLEGPAGSQLFLIFSGLGIFQGSSVLVYRYSCFSFTRLALMFSLQAEVTSVNFPKINILQHSCAALIISGQLFHINLYILHASLSVGSPDVELRNLHPLPPHPPAVRPLWTQRSVHPDTSLMRSQRLSSAHFLLES